MVKRIVLTLVQFIVFLGLLAVGGNWDVINLSLQVRAMMNHATAFNPIPVVRVPMGSHILIADGLIFATVLLVIVVLFQALRKRLHPWASLSGLAYLLAVTLGFAMKLGLPPAN
jgi:hypothetical protein